MHGGNFLLVERRVVELVDRGIATGEIARNRRDQASAVLKAMGTTQAIGYVHLGWILALLSGIVTWLLAQTVITFSGAQRELVEGFTSLLAAAVLFFVSYWLISKAEAKRWQTYIQSRVQEALSGRRLFALVGVSFLAVYREGFETILFYQALLGSAGREGVPMVLAGFRRVGRIHASCRRPRRATALCHLEQEDRPGRNGVPVEERLPILLHRTAYDKDRAGERPEVEVFVRHGYVVVIQDCRGRYRSEGRFTKYLGEANDGCDTLAWISAQPWCNGRIGTFGLSYAAHTQTALASQRPRGLAAMFTDCGGFANAYRGGIRHGGAFELKQATWAYKQALLSPRAEADPVIRAALDASGVAGRQQARSKYGAKRGG